MNSRERWTVYPLLFLAVGLGIKTRITGIDNVPAIGCKNLTINGEDGKPLVRIHATPANQGQIEFFSSEGKLMIAAGGANDGKAWQFVIADGNGKPKGFFAIDTSSTQLRNPTPGAPEALPTEQENPKPISPESKSDPEPTTSSP